MISPMSARTRSSSASILPASSRSNSARRARWPNAAARAARASPASTPRPASARRWPRARKRRVFDGEDYILERGIIADLSIIKGWKADEAGNLDLPQDRAQLQPADGDRRQDLRRRGRGDRAGGRLDPDGIHVPGIYVKRLICGAPYDKRIEFRTVRQREAAYAVSAGPATRWPRAPRGSCSDGYLRQSRHRHPDAGGEPYPRGRGGDAPVRERDARHRAVPV